MRAVNLLPGEVAKTKTRRVSAPLLTGAIAGFVVVAVLVGGFVKQSAKVSHNRTKLDAARAELALIPAPVAPSTSSTALGGEQIQRIAALQNALNGRIAWDRMLREIALVLPSDVWLTGLTLQAPAAPAPVIPTGTDSQAAPPPAMPASPTASDLTMTGMAYTHDGVARLLSRLALVPDLDNVTLAHSTRQELGKHGSVEFSVLSGIRIPGATQ